MIKSKAAKGMASITFTVDPQVGAQVAAVCGDWNDWSPGADVMSPDGEGGFSLTVERPRGELTGSGISWTATGGRTTGPPTPTSPTTSAPTTPWWT